MSESLSAEAIDRIVKLADKARKVDFVRQPGEPASVYWKLNTDGSASTVRAEAPICNGQFDRPDDVVDHLKANPNPVTVYYDETQIAVIDQEDCRHRADCKLHTSPQFGWLKSKSAQAFNQQAFVRLLRIDFRGCLDGAPELLAIVRNLKFTSAGQVAGNIQHGRESLGRSIESQVSGESSIPEEIRVTVPIWSNWNVREDIWCAIEIDSGTATFKLTPYPSELDNAIDRALSKLHSLLQLTDDKAAKAAPVYRGRPIVEELVGTEEE